MKQITLLVASALLLLTACGQVENSPAEVVPPLAIETQENVRQPQAAPKPATAVKEPDTVSGAAEEQPQKGKAPQTETAPQATQPLEPVEEPTPTEDIPSETIHAKTGYVEPEPTLEPEPTPEPTAPADRQAAIDEANAYAATQYGVTTDSSLTLDNSAYRFPAAVPVDASQETLEAKARDMVDFTFRQLMMQAGRDSAADAGFHCNVCIVEDGGNQSSRYHITAIPAISDGAFCLIVAKNCPFVARRTMKRDILTEYYRPLLAQNSFRPIPCPDKFSPAGQCWEIAPTMGGGYYWVYATQELFDIKIHDFFFHEDQCLDMAIPECTSIQRYDSISGEELDPYRRLSAGDIQTIVGGKQRYHALIHKRIPIHAVGIEILPAYYENFLKERYPDICFDLPAAFQSVDQATDFPAMSKLLFEIENYRGEGAAATLFYEAKVTEAIALVVDAWKRQSRKQEKPLSDADRVSLQNVVSYIADHYAFDIPLERLVSIACMSETKLKSCFKRQFGCSVTQYIQGRRMSQAEHLLINTDFTMGQIAQMIGYTPPAGSRSCSKRARASCPLSIGKSPGANKLATPQGDGHKSKMHRIIPAKKSSETIWFPRTFCAFAAMLPQTLIAAAEG